MLLLLQCIFAFQAIKIETESWCYQSINQNLCEYLGILSKSFNAKKKMLKKTFSVCLNKMKNVKMSELLPLLLLFQNKKNKIILGFNK
jgi:hypothetical protein